MTEHRQQQPRTDTGSRIDQEARGCRVSKVGPYTMVEKPIRRLPRPLAGPSPEWVPRLGGFVVDTSADEDVTGEVRGWDGEEVTLCVPGEEELRYTRRYREATMKEALPVKTALLNLRRRAW